MTLQLFRGKKNIAKLLHVKRHEPNGPFENFDFRVRAPFVRSTFRIVEITSEAELANERKRLWNVGNERGETMGNLATVVRNYGVAPRGTTTITATTTNTAAAAIAVGTVTFNHIHPLLQI